MPLHSLRYAWMQAVGEIPADKATLASAMSNAKAVSERIRQLSHLCEAYAPGRAEYIYSLRHVVSRQHGILLQIHGLAKVSLLETYTIQHIVRHHTGNR